MEYGRYIVAADLSDVDLLKDIGISTSEEE